jgi:NTP pyrophosphatase (non-canonical NTP hydrolase)
MKPQYEPTTLSQKLGYLVEECGEVLAAVGKTLRWGPQSFNPELPESERETNREWILRELLDLQGAIVRVQKALTRNPKVQLEDE